MMKNYLIYAITIEKLNNYASFLGIPFVFCCYHDNTITE